MFDEFLKTTHYIKIVCEHIKITSLTSNKYYKYYFHSTFWLHITKMSVLQLVQLGDRQHPINRPSSSK